MQDVWQNLGMTLAAKVGGNGLWASLTPIPAQVWFGAGVSDTTGASYSVFPYWSTDVCLNWQKNKYLANTQKDLKAVFFILLCIYLPSVSPASCTAALST